jgi:hypothetical protein
MIKNIFSIRSRAGRFLFALAAGVLQFSGFAVVATAAEPTVPLYRYQTKTGLDAYVAFPAELESYDKLGKQTDDPKNGFIFFRRLMSVGHVYITKLPGTLPLLMLFKDTDLGRKYFYTTDIDEAVILQKNGWQPGFFNKGVTCYVATKPQAGTIPVYRLQQPDGVDILYAFGNKERQMVSHLKEEKVAFYVWATAVTPASEDKPKQYDFPELKPDLWVGNIKEVQAKSVTFVINNSGGEKLIPANTFTVQISAKNADGNAAWFEQQPIAQAIQPQTPTTVTVNTDHDMRGLKIRLLVDAMNKVEESNEQNNLSGYIDGPIFLVKGVITKPSSTPIILPVPSQNQLPTPPAPVVWDLSMRLALYINGTETQKVNKQAKYVGAGKTITLKKSEALSCEGDRCTFNLAFFVFRNGATGELSTYALISGETLGSVGNSLTFPSGATTKDMVLPGKLIVGVNKLTVTVDPYKKLAETNENNNQFEVTIIVEP